MSALRPSFAPSQIGHERTAKHASQIAERREAYDAPKRRSRARQGANPVKRSGGAGNRSKK